MQMQATINTSEDFKHPLQELETYVGQSHNAQLVDSFQKFKMALSENDNRLNDIARFGKTQAVPVATKPPTPEDCYLAMSSLFSANIKIISPTTPEGESCEQHK